VPQAQHHPWGGGIVEVEDFRKTLWVSGGAGIFRKSLWEKLGGMSELYNPFYYEDIDLSYRALKAGYKLVFEPKSIVFHQSQTGSIRNNYSPYQIKSIAYRNQILFVWLNISDIPYIIEHLIYLPYHAIYALLTSDNAFIKGLLMAVFSLSRVSVQRKFNHKSWIVTDREALRKITD
jgi:GT2 family glycosyltransferase